MLGVSGLSASGRFSVWEDFGRWTMDCLGLYRGSCTVAVLLSALSGAARAPVYTVRLSVAGGGAGGSGVVWCSRCGWGKVAGDWVRCGFCWHGTRVVVFMS